MITNRFGNSGSVNLEVSKQHVAPYDPKLTFNRVVESKKENPQSAVYSIDASAMLTALEADRLEELYRITLVARVNNSTTPGLWDTLFNNAARRSLTACLFTAGENFQLMPAERVGYTSQFLNYSLLVSRIHLNQVKSGDRVGVSIHDMLKNRTYVLLYQIDSLCLATTPKTTSGGGRPGLVPAVNLRMGHVLQIESNGDNVVVDMEQDSAYDSETMTPFVQWLYNTTAEIARAYASDEPVKAYPWKPHLLPRLVLGDQRRSEIQDRLVKQNESAIEVNAEEFDTLCRQVYDEARQRFHANRSKNRKDDNASKLREVPLVEVVSSPEAIFFNFGEGDEPQQYRLPVAELDGLKRTEYYLTNQDLTPGSISAESPKLMILDSDKFGQGAYLRYFTINY